jgi:hypothetical protein
METHERRPGAGAGAGAGADADADARNGIGPLMKWAEDMGI